jgi:hypothetical protein
MRWFLECEMGGHSLSNPDEKSGSTIAKLRRYAEFYSAYADTSGRLTFYRKTYQDGWAAELVFLVPTTGRRDGVLRTIEAWRKEEGQLSVMSSRSVLQARAVTFEDAPALFRSVFADGEVLPAAGSAATVAPHATIPLLADDEALRLMKFTASLYDRFKELRAKARAEARPLPAYPSEVERLFIVELLARKGVRRSA